MEVRSVHLLDQDGQNEWMSRYEIFHLSSLSLTLFLTLLFLRLSPPFICEWPLIWWFVAALICSLGGGRTAGRENAMEKLWIENYDEKIHLSHPEKDVLEISFPSSELSSFWSFFLEFWSLSSCSSASHSRKWLLSFNLLQSLSTLSILGLNIKHTLNMLFSGRDGKQITRVWLREWRTLSLSIFVLYLLQQIRWKMFDERTWKKEAGVLIEYQLLCLQSNPLILSMTLLFK